MLPPPVTLRFSTERKVRSMIASRPVPLPALMLSARLVPVPAPTAKLSTPAEPRTCRVSVALPPATVKSMVTPTTAPAPFM